MSKRGGDGKEKKEAQELRDGSPRARGQARSESVLRPFIKIPLL